MTQGQEPSKFIPSLDGIRAAAVMTVLLGHAHVPYVRGSVGVTVFFFLSGYLITTLLRMEYDRNGRISLRDFWLRRVLRILPPLYLVLAAILGLLAVGVIDGGQRWWGTLGAGLHASNYIEALGQEDYLPRGSGIFWSVAVEEHFYVLFPLLYIGLRRWTQSRAAQACVLAVLCTLALAWRLVLHFGLGVSHDWLYYATDARADGLLLGCLLAVAANPVLDPVRLPVPAMVWGALPLGLLLTFGTAYAPWVIADTVGFTAQGVGVALILYTVVAAPTSWAGRVLNWRPIAFIGVLSYGIYLTHRLIQIPLQETFELRASVVVALSLLGTVAISWGLHVWVEQPAARLRRRLSHVLPAGRSPRGDRPAGELASQL